MARTDAVMLSHCLADPATHGGATVKRVDTHAGVVFLGPASARSSSSVRCNFRFLTIPRLRSARRPARPRSRSICPYAPELYRSGVAITREADGRLAIGGQGEPAEYAVEMRRFDETQTLDRLAAEGSDRRPRSPTRSGVRSPPRMREGAPTAPPEPWIAALGSYITEHEAAFAGRCRRCSILPPTNVSPAQCAMRLAASSHSSPRRGRRELIRGRRGDLHLGNIALIDGRANAVRCHRVQRHLSRQATCSMTLRSC